jgi:diguanylate cyclase (GGDEF)-like protein
LTGAVNPRFFFDLLQMEIDRSKHYAHPFTIAYIDIDDFKIIGDWALCTLIDRARQHLRKTDLVARLGGDEFAMLLIVPRRFQLCARASPYLSLIPTLQITEYLTLRPSGYPASFSYEILTTKLLQFVLSLNYKPIRLVVKGD